MRPLTASVAISLAVACCFFPWAATAGDTIYFKDGMRTVCHGKAWEEKNEVHCEYDGGILIYQKSEVVRIEKSPSTESEAVSEKIDEAEQQPSSDAVSIAPQPATIPAPAPLPSSGILFYDPRRPKPYWSSESRHHDSYQDAINALAEEFNTSSQWVEAHMGESNDVLMIRERLKARKVENDIAPASAEIDQENGGVEFYNPRRPQKYWTGPDARHDTFREAVETLAAEFKKPAAWIETHMGDSNDTAQIRRSLRSAQNAAQLQMQDGDPAKETSRFNR